MVESESENTETFINGWTSHWQPRNTFPGTVRRDRPFAARPGSYSKGDMGCLGSLDYHRTCEVASAHFSIFIISCSAACCQLVEEKRAVMSLFANLVVDSCAAAAEDQNEFAVEDMVESKAWKTNA